MRPAVAILLLVVLAGCAQRAPTPTQLEGVAPLPQAREVAAAWMADAEMTEVVGIESGASVAPSQWTDPFYSPLWAADRIVGDGLAPAWLVRFAAGESRLEVILAPNGDELARREGPPGSFAGPLPPDLHAVTDGLAQQLDDLRPGWGAALGVLVWRLAEDRGVPVWTLAVGEDGLAAQYEFEARTATPLRPVAPDAPAAPLARLRAEAAGNDSVTSSLATVRTSTAHSLELHGHHRELAVQVQVTGPVPGELDAELVAPNGTVTPLAGGVARIEWPGTGNWQLKVAVAGGSPVQDFAYWLCAPGEDPGQGCGD